MDEMVDRTTGEATVRYSRGAATFHWLTVGLVLVQLYLGFCFADLPRGPARIELFTWHKTVGATILVVTLLRVAYRLINPPPPYPSELPRWDRFTAVWSHRAVYAMLLLLPLTGLIAVSDGARDGWVRLVGGLAIPRVPGISKATGDASGDIHELLVWTTIALLVVHVLAAIYHHLIARDLASGRMPPLPSTAVSSGPEAESASLRQ